MASCSDGPKYTHPSRANLAITLPRPDSHTQDKEADFFVLCEHSDLQCVPFLRHLCGAPLSLYSVPKGAENSIFAFCSLL